MHSIYSAYYVGISGWQSWTADPCCEADVLVACLRDIDCLISVVMLICLWILAVWHFQKSSSSWLLSSCFSCSFSITWLMWHLEYSYPSALQKSSLLLDHWTQSHTFWTILSTMSYSPIFAGSGCFVKVLMAAVQPITWGQIQTVFQ